MLSKNGNSDAHLPQDIFPLPLSDFEYYMLTDDRESHPMVFVIVVNISGLLSEIPFREALTELMEAHPLFRCRVQKIPGKGWCWTPIDICPDTLEWPPGDAAAVTTCVPPVVSLNIRQKSGLHCKVIVEENNAVVVLYLHHACCDGLGALQVIGELFARYGQKTAAPGAKMPEYEAVNSQVLLQRENYETGEAAAERQKKSLKRTLGKISRLLLRAPVMLACSADFRRAGLSAPKPGGSGQSDAGAIQSRVLSKSTHRSLRAAATELGVSMNDIFLREMLLQIRDWNRRAGVPFGRRWIRLAVPLSMRTSAHERMPAANVVSYALVTRREQDCEDPCELLSSIHQQTSDVLFNREGIVCLKLFRVLRKIGAMKMFLSLKSVLSTMVLANVGDVRRRFSGRFPLHKGRWIAGNVIIEQIHGVAPVRPNTRVAMSIGDYAGEISISLRTDGRLLNAADSQRFLDDFLKRLHSLAGEPTEDV